MILVVFSTVLPVQCPWTNLYKYQLLLLLLDIQVYSECLKTCICIHYGILWCFQQLCIQTCIITISVHFTRALLHFGSSLLNDDEY